jgi:pyruvate dehydrogenase E2 component (dihydrolipoamide acetyltransferase)
MGAIKEVHVPDIGDFSGVDVVEVLVSPGDTVAVEDPLITLESDKASMEVPSPEAGVVKEVKVKSGDKVSEGDVIVLLEADAAVASPHTDEGEAPPAVADTTDSPVEQSTAAAAATSDQSKTPTPPTAAAASQGALQEVKVPDIGDFQGVDVIDVLVKPGDSVDVETPLIVLESDKASMEVPSPEAGVIKELRIKPGDKVSQGDVVLILETETADAATADQTVPAAEPPAAVTLGPTARKPATFEARQPPLAPTPMDEAAFAQVHASPSVRRFARELGADLSRIGEGSGRKGRITKEDVQQFIKQALAGQAAPVAGTPAGSGIPPIPAVDFEKFGPIEVQSLSKIKRLTGTNMSRNWLNVPHVTHNDEADITDTEAFRKSLTEEAKAREVRVTLLSFLLKVCAVALRDFPTFNASLDPNGEQLIVKKYVHIGVAVDTPDGLVVPVIRDVDQKTVFTLSKELSDYSAKARAKQLMPGDMQGGCFTISSLGGISGTTFTPIVNAPEVAILGVTRAKMTPTWDGKGFVPRLILPLSLSYDHRVIDGAQAARFVRFLCEAIADMRRLLL